MTDSSKTTSLRIPSKVQDNAEFYTLSAAVYSVLEDIEMGEELFNRFLHFAIEGYKEYHFDQSHVIEVVEIDMLPWKQIKLPPNYVDWVKVGFRCGDLIKVLTKDANISKAFTMVNGVPQENAPAVPILDASSSDIIPLYNYYGWGQNLYGIALNWNHLGYFDVDDKNRVINFKETVTGLTKVYLEYIGDGINYTGQTIIHPYAFRQIKLWIHWQRKENDDRFGEGERARALSLYENEVDKVAMRQLDMSLDDIREALRAGHRQTPKL